MENESLYLIGYVGECMQSYVYLGIIRLLSVIPSHSQSSATRLIQILVDLMDQGSFESFTASSGTFTYLVAVRSA